MLCGILFYSKSLLYESTLKMKKKVKGRKLRALPKMKKKTFFNFGGPRNFTPYIFQLIWGCFHTAKFWSRKGSRKAFFRKITFQEQTLSFWCLELCHGLHVADQGICLLTTATILWVLPGFPLVVPLGTTGLTASYKWWTLAEMSL